MKLTDPTDEELNAAFAEHVAGFTQMEIRTGRVEGYNEHGLWLPVPSYLSVNAVLPWLAKEKCATIGYHNWPGTNVAVGWHVKVDNMGNGTDDPSFARAIMVELLKMRGVEVGFPSRPRMPTYDERMAMPHYPPHNLDTPG